MQIWQSFKRGSPATHEVGLALLVLLIIILHAIVARNVITYSIAAPHGQMH